MSEIQNKYRRFSAGQRVEHILLILSFTVLSITGLPQKYPDSVWGGLMIQWMGGIEFVRIIHRISATVLMAETIYHTFAVTYKVWVKRMPLTMMPGLQDAKDALQTLLYNFRISAQPPQMGRYTFGEKVEYWAVIWGTVIMVMTGFMLWNPIATANFFPGQFIPAAKAAHGGEALLAVLSIVTWHIYNVHVKQFNRSMFTGYISRHEMEHEHPQELNALMSGKTAVAVDEAAMQRRRRLFVPIATLIALALSLGLYTFVTFEETAITTVPRSGAEVYVPLTPTTPP